MNSFVFHVLLQHPHQTRERERERERKNYLLLDSCINFADESTGVVTESPGSGVSSLGLAPSPQANSLTHWNSNLTYPDGPCQDQMIQCLLQNTFHSAWLNHRFVLQRAAFHLPQRRFNRPLF